MNGTDRREALEELLGSDGWRIFVDYVMREWQGEGYVQRMGAALAKDTIEPHVIHRMGQEAVRLMKWPTIQVRELKGVTE